MNKILVLIPYYFPGFRSGGPQQSIRNLADAFGKQLDLYIYTQNHDFGSDIPYEGVPYDQWVKLFGSHIWYASSDYYGKRFKEFYSSFDCIYSCGFFEKNTIKLLFLHKRKKAKKEIYIAPMGVFSEGAINIKRYKKELFLKLGKLLKIFAGGGVNQIIWSVSSLDELTDTKKYLGEEIVQKYIVAEDLPRKVYFNNSLEKAEKRGDYEVLKIVFLSRITPKKNLDYCADILNQKYSKHIQFDIYGILEDKEYWKKCQEKLSTLPQNVTANYCGELNPDKVIQALSSYDVFLFPTKGENYGHVIYEALAAGCVTIISDTTPWKGFEVYGCGRVVRLDDLEGFQSSIEDLCRTDRDRLVEMKKNSVRFAEKTYKNSVTISGYKHLMTE